MSNDRFSKLRQAMSDGEHLPPPHFVRRIMALLGDDEAHYIDAAPRTTSGWAHWTAVVLTTDRVVFATSRTRLEPDTDRSNSWCTTWARRDLTSVTIADATGAADEGWSRTTGSEWPNGSLMSLQYAGHEQPLHLPVRDDERTRRHLQRLVPDLLADLTR